MHSPISILKKPKITRYHTITFPSYNPQDPKRCCGPYNNAITARPSLPRVGPKPDEDWDKPTTSTSLLETSKCLVSHLLTKPSPAFSRPPPPTRQWYWWCAKTVSVIYICHHCRECKAGRWQPFHRRHKGNVTICDRVFLTRSTAFQWWKGRHRRRGRGDAGTSLSPKLHYAIVTQF